MELRKKVATMKLFTCVTSIIVVLLQESLKIVLVGRSHAYTSSHHKNNQRTEPQRGSSYCFGGIDN